MLIELCLLPLQEDMSKFSAGVFIVAAVGQDNWAIFGIPSCMRDREIVVIVPVGYRDGLPPPAAVRHVYKCFHAAVGLDAWFIVEPMEHFHRHPARQYANNPCALENCSLIQKMTTLAGIPVLLYFLQFPIFLKNYYIFLYFFEIFLYFPIFTTISSYINSYIFLTLCWDPYAQSTELDPSMLYWSQD